jgi:hypothetical protein
LNNAAVRRSKARDPDRQFKQVNSNATLNNKKVSSICMAIDSPDPGSIQASVTRGPDGTSDAWLLGENQTQILSCCKQKTPNSSCLTLQCSKKKKNVTPAAP